MTAPDPRETPPVLIDDGFLDERIPRHEATVEPRGCSGCSVFGYVVLAVVVLWRWV